MSRLVFHPLPVQPSGANVRIDTASGSNSPASGLLSVEGSPILSTLASDGVSGAVPAFLGPDGTTTLYVKTLNSAGAVTATATLAGTSSGSAPPSSTDLVAALVNGAPGSLDTLGEVATALAALPGAYVPFIGAASYTYNADGTVATATEGGIVTTYAYNADGSVHTATRSGVTVTYTYNADGTVASVA